MFECPGCKTSHGIPVDQIPSEYGSKWQWNGSMDYPTFSPSIHVFPHGAAPPFTPQPRCHSFVKDGKIQFLGDCEHELKNQTVDLPEWV